MKKNILIVVNNSSHTQMLGHRFSSYNVTRIKYGNLTPDAVQAADILVLSGGYPSVFRHHWFYRQEIEIIRTSNKPILGICLGFELIIRAYGGELHKLPRKVHGLGIVTVGKNNLAIDEAQYAVWESHKWAAKTAPPFFHVVATSPAGPELIVHQKRPVIGCQFHPEVIEPRNDGSYLLDKMVAALDQWPE